MGIVDAMRKSNADGDCAHCVQKCTRGKATWLTMVAWFDRDSTASAQCLCEGKHIGARVTGVDVPCKHLHLCGLLSNRWPTGQADYKAPMVVPWRSLCIGQVFEHSIWYTLAEDLVACKHAVRWNR